MTDLSPSSFSKLSDRLLNDEQLAITYLNTQSNGGFETKVSSCDEVCRKQVYCETRNAVYFDIKDCLGEQRLDIVNDAMNTFLEFMGDPWYAPAK